LAVINVIDKNTPFYNTPAAGDVSERDVRAITAHGSTAAGPRDIAR